MTTTKSNLKFKELRCPASDETQKEKPSFFRRCSRTALTLACMAAFTFSSPKAEPIFSIASAEARPEKKVRVSTMIEFQ